MMFVVFGFAVYAFASAVVLIHQDMKIRRLQTKNFELRVELQKTKLYVAKEYGDGF